MVIWLGLPHYPHQVILIGWLSWSTLRLYDSWKTAQVFGVLPNLLCVVRSFKDVVYFVNLFGMHLRVFFLFWGSFCLTRVHLDSPWWNRKKHTPSVKAPQGVLGLDEKHVSNKRFCIDSSWVQKKCLIIQDDPWGLNWRKGNTENDGADDGHDNEQKDDHDEEHEDRNHLTIAIESKHISVLCCCVDDFIDPCQNNSLMSMTPNYHHHPSLPKKDGSLLSLSTNQNTLPKVNL